MSVQGIRMGKAYVELGTDASKMQSGLRDAKAQLESFSRDAMRAGATMGAAGAAILAPLAASVVQFAKTGDELDKMSKRTTVSVESLGELKYAAERSGQSLGVIESGLRRLATVMQEAERGSTKYQDALAAAGVSMSDLAGLPLDQRMQKIADGLSRVSDEGQRVALASEIFGRSAGGAILSMADDMATLRGEARELGIVMSTEQATAAAKFNDALLDLQRTLGAVGREVATALLPALEDTIRQVRPVVKAFAEWVGENPKLIQALAGVGVALVAVGGGLTALGVAIKLGLSAMSGLAAGAAALTKAKLALAAAMGKVAAASATVSTGLGTMAASYPAVASAIAGLTKGLAAVKAAAIGLAPAFGAALAPAAAVYMTMAKMTDYYTEVAENNLKRLAGRADLVASQIADAFKRAGGADVRAGEMVSAEGTVQAASAILREDIQRYQDLLKNTPADSAEAANKAVWEAQLSIAQQTLGVLDGLQREAAASAKLAAERREAERAAWQERQRRIESGEAGMEEQQKEREFQAQQLRNMELAQKEEAGRARRPLEGRLAEASDALTLARARGVDPADEKRMLADVFEARKKLVEAREKEIRDAWLLEVERQRRTGEFDPAAAVRRDEELHRNALALRNLTAAHEAEVASIDADIEAREQSAAAAEKMLAIRQMEAERDVERAGGTITAEKEKEYARRIFEARLAAAEGDASAELDARREFSLQMLGMQAGAMDDAPGRRDVSGGFSVRAQAFARDRDQDALKKANQETANNTRDIRDVLVEAGAGIVLE